MLLQKSPMSILFFFCKKKKKNLTATIRGGKKNPNPLAHPNPLTNCPPKPTYLINGQMGASPIRPN